MCLYIYTHLRIFATYGDTAAAVEKVLKKGLLLPQATQVVDTL